MTPAFKLIIALHLTSVCCNAQADHEYLATHAHVLTEKPLSWPHHEYSLNEQAVVRSLISNTRFSCQDESGPKLPSFHFMDLDGDSDQDVVFNGLECIGFESETIRIFMNRDSILVEVLNEAGRIASLSANQIIIHSYPCCAEYVNKLVVYEIGQDHMKKKNSLVFFSFTYTGSK